MTDKEFIFKILYIAFLEIRIASYANDSQTCFIISDVFHNVPLQLNRAEKGEMDYAEIVTWIKDRCKMRNCEAWLDNAIANIARLP